MILRRGFIGKNKDFHTWTRIHGILNKKLGLEETELLQQPILIIVREDAYHLDHYGDLIRKFPAGLDTASKFYELAEVTEPWVGNGY